MTGQAVVIPCTGRLLYTAVPEFPVKIERHIFLILVFLLPFARSSAQQVDDMKTVLERASKYVEKYEDEQLGTLLIKEKYNQNVVIFPTTGVRLAQTQKREILSDFLLLQVGKNRLGVRKVISVDGTAVKADPKSLESVLDDSPESMSRQIAALRTESFRYDIGGIVRQSNVPTYALKVLHIAEMPRFEFTRDGNEKVDGLQTWKIKFQELRSPTLLHGVKGESLMSWGRLWIEPFTGRVLKTQFEVDNSIPSQEAKGKSTVSYSQDKKLGFLVPSEMSEHWEKPGTIVDCTMKYSDFRSFNVDVQADLTLPKVP